MRVTELANIQETRLYFGKNDANACEARETKCVCTIYSRLSCVAVANSEPNARQQAIARNKRTRAYIFRILLRLRYRRSQWQTLGAWYKASALGLYVRGICPPIIV